MAKAWEFWAGTSAFFEKMLADKIGDEWKDLREQWSKVRATTSANLKLPDNTPASTQRILEEALLKVWIAVLYSDVENESRDDLVDFLEECRNELWEMAERTTQRRQKSRGCTIDCGGDFRRLPVRRLGLCSLVDEALEPVLESEEEIEEEERACEDELETSCDKKFCGEVVKIHCKSPREWMSGAGRGQRQVRGCTIGCGGDVRLYVARGTARRGENKKLDQRLTSSASCETQRWQ